MQRKVFRVEQMIGVGRDSKRVRLSQADNHAVADSAPHRPALSERDLAALRAIVAHTKRELFALINDGKERRMTRGAGELSAAVESMEAGTQKILASVEVIDDCARTLASALDDEYHHGLAQDMQDHVVRIYEACNFQDLAGQRIGKVISTLVMIEEKLASMIVRCDDPDAAHEPASAAAVNADSDLINGPRLDGDSGHASQVDIDKMFA